jgi:hypothetical protein
VLQEDEHGGIFSEGWRTEVVRRVQQERRDYAQARGGKMPDKGEQRKKFQAWFDGLLDRAAKDKKYLAALASTEAGIEPISEKEWKRFEHPGLNV